MLRPSRIRSLSSLASAAPRVAPQPLRSVLEVSGPDAKKFLKGQMCKDIDNTGGGYSGFLNASGRVLHTVFCIPSKPNTYLISHESGADHPAPLAQLLPPFRLRAKIRIKDVSDEWDVWSAWGSEVDSSPPTSTWRFGSGGAAERLWTWEGKRAALGLAESEVGCWDLRAGWGEGGMGRQVFVPKGQRPSLASSHDMATTDEYNLRRMTLGVPEGSAEVVPGSALPLESDMDIHGGVDVRKGCYLGQELTVRTYHTGATRKRLLPAYLYLLSEGPGDILASGSPSPSPLPLPGLVGGAQRADIMYTPPAGAASKKARSAGKLLALSNASPAVGMALVRLEWADRACWANGGENGTLSVDIGGTQYGVWIGKGEGYAAALEATPPPRVADEEEDLAHASLRT